MSKTVSGTTTQLLWDVASSLALLLKDGSTAYVYGPGGQPLEQINGSAVLWLHHDQIGSTRLVSDSTGASQATYTYDAYGNLTASTGAITNPIRFAGQYRDTESGLYYLRARYYDPSTGQFLSRDPAVARTREPYAYVNDNPLNASDPDGLFGWNDIANGAKAVANFGLKIAAIPPYAVYYGIYRTQSSIGQYLPTPVNEVITAIDRGLLDIDRGIDRLKRATGSDEPDRDEGQNDSYIEFRIKGISKCPGDRLHGFLPGYEPDGTTDLYPQRKYPWSEGFGDKPGYPGY